MATKPDPIKLLLRNLCEQTFRARSTHDEMARRCLRAETSVVDNTTLQIKLYDGTGMPRYFNIKVSEGL